MLIFCKFFNHKEFFFFFYCQFIRKILFADSQLYVNVFQSFAELNFCVIFYKRIIVFLREFFLNSFMENLRASLDP